MILHSNWNRWIYLLKLDISQSYGMELLNETISSSDIAVPFGILYYIEKTLHFSESSMIHKGISHKVLPQPCGR